MFDAPHGPQPVNRRRRRVLVAAMGSMIAIGATSVAGATSSGPAGSHVERVTGGPNGTYIVPPGIHKIKHVIIIEQENRSFDNYFGTYPGVDGIPMKNGMPTVCVQNPATKGCTKPYHDTTDEDGGGPHGEPNAVADT